MLSATVSGGKLRVSQWFLGNKGNKADLEGEARAQNSNEFGKKGKCKLWEHTWCNPCGEQGTKLRKNYQVNTGTQTPWGTLGIGYKNLDVVFNKREVVFYQSTKGRGRSPRPFVL